MKQDLHRFFIILGFATICLSSISFHHVDATHPEGFASLLEGIDAMNNSEFEKAIEFFDEFLREHPNDILALYLTGLAFSGLGNSEEALDYYDEVAEKEPNNFFITSLQGLTLVDLERYEEALIPINNALKLEIPSDYQYLPKDIQRALGQLRDEINYELLLNKGIALLQLEKYAESSEYFDEVLNRDPKKFEGLYYSGLALYHLEKYKESLEYVEKLVKLGEHDSKTLILQGNILNKLEKPNDALFWLDLALKTDPRNAELLISKGDSLALLGNKNAMNFYDKGLLHEPENIEGLFGKGILLENLDKDEEALVYYERILDIEPDNVKALEKKNEMLEAIGKSIEPKKQPQIPDWIKNNADWWAQGAIGDSDFVAGIQFLIKEGIMEIPATDQIIPAGGDKEIPSWIKNNADWWAQGLISDDDFVKGIQYLVENGIVVV